MGRPLNEQTVVLTGASSGIGKETAVELGRRGANVVLAARNEEALRDAARAVEAAGGKAEVVLTDVSDRTLVDRLADQAVARFGRIDTWVNDAAVALYATVEDATVEEIEQVLRVNLLGAIYGMKAALPVMKRQGEGTIVNVSSVLGKMSVPLQAAYCASKHGMIGFADSLRVELARESSKIEVVTVMPTSMNTPFFDHARAKLGGRRPMPIPPAYDPAAVAQAIAHVCEHPQRDVVVGGTGKLMVLLSRLSPQIIDWLLLAGDGGVKLQTSERPALPRDGLFAPVAGVESARGEWGDKPWTLGTSLYTRWFELHPTLKLATVGLAALGVAALVGRSGRRETIAPPPEQIAYAG
jgi:NAD(P)-dependent dehydrogenase (short-subunit alcohol dehydrogenase family)